MLTHQFISELIAATRTDTGHTVRCRLDQATYPKGIIVTDDQLAAVNITRGAFHGEWNYTIAPRTTELVEPSPEPIAVIIAVRPLSRVTPVRLPPGRARLATSPSATGSLPIRKMIGIVEVAFFAARAEVFVPGVTITFTGCCAH